MTIELSKSIAQDYFDRVLNLGELVVADQIFATSIIFNYPLGRLNGSEAVKSYIVEFRAAFPDAHFNVAALLADTSCAAARWTLVGTQAGEFKGRPSAGRQVNLPGMTWFKIADDRIQEMWVSFNPSQLVD